MMCTLCANVCVCLFVLTGHLHLCSPVYYCSHPVPHQTLIQASISPLQRWDRQPEDGQTQRKESNQSVFYLWAVNKPYKNEQEGFGSDVWRPARQKGKEVEVCLSICMHSCVISLHDLDLRMDCA